MGNCLMYMKYYFVTSRMEARDIQKNAAIATNARKQQACIASIDKSLEWLKRVPKTSPHYHELQSHVLSMRQERTNASKVLETNTDLLKLSHAHEGLVSTTLGRKETKEMAKQQRKRRLEQLANMRAAADDHSERVSILSDTLHDTIDADADTRDELSADLSALADATRDAVNELEAEIQQQEDEEESEKNDTDGVSKGERIVIQIDGVSSGHGGRGPGSSDEPLQIPPVPVIEPRGDGDVAIEINPDRQAVLC